MKSQYHEMIKNWAKDPYITHTEDPTICGQCYMQLITSEVSKAFLSKNKANTKDDLIELTQEIERKWQETALYKKMQGLKDSGLTMEEAIKEMEKIGYIP
jgi:hypothetical protein